MRASRKNFFAGAAGSYAAIRILKYRANAAEFAYKLGNDVPITHPIASFAIQAAARVLQETNGRVEIRVFPDSALGGQAQMVSQIRLGALEFLTIADNVLAGSIPAAGISAVPFAFPSYKSAWDAMDGPLGKYLRSVNTAANLYTFERSWDAGFRHVSNSIRPVNEPDDLRGLKLRVPEAPMPVAMFKAFGVSPTPVSSAQQYTAMQTHLVDGQEAALPAVETFKLYEVQKYESLTGHAWTGYRVHCNKDAWEKLPPALRVTVEKVFNTTGEAERLSVSRGDVALEATLKGRGMIFNQPNVASFKAVLTAAGLYRQWRDNFGPDVWTLLEKAVGKLA